MRSVCRWVLAIGLLPALPIATRAELRLAETTISLGEVRGGMPIARRITFTNDGPEKIEITGLHASCGCTKPRLEKLTYAPGDKGELLLEINTLSQSAGDHVWTVQVTYRTGGELHEQTVRLTGRIIAEVQVQPAALTVFTDHALEHTLIVTDIRANPFKLTEARASASYLRAQIGEPSHDDRGHWTCAVKLEVSADCPEGRHEERLDLKTSDPDYAELRIPVIVVKRAKQRLTATPNPVVLTVPPGQPAATRLIVVRDEHGEAVVIDSVEADDAALTCTWSEGAYTPGAVRVRLDPKALREGGLHSAVHIHISKPIETTLTVPVQASAP
jgi:hypothetical protein